MASNIRVRLQIKVRVCDCGGGSERGCANLLDDSRKGGVRDQCEGNFRYGVVHRIVILSGKDEKEGVSLCHIVCSDNISVDASLQRYPV